MVKKFILSQIQQQDYGKYRSERKDLIDPQIDPDILISLSQIK